MSQCGLDLSHVHRSQLLGGTQWRTSLLLPRSDTCSPGRMPLLINSMLWTPGSWWNGLQIMCRNERTHYRFHMDFRVQGLRYHGQKLVTIAHPGNRNNKYEGNILMIIGIMIAIWFISSESFGKTLLLVAFFWKNSLRPRAKILRNIFMI